MRKYQFTVHYKDTRTRLMGVVQLSSQLTFTCSSSTIETLEKRVKYG